MGRFGVRISAVSAFARPESHLTRQTMHGALGEEGWSWSSGISIASSIASWSSLCPRTRPVAASHAHGRDPGRRPGHERAVLLLEAAPDNEGEPRAWAVHGGPGRVGVGVGVGVLGNGAGQGVASAGVWQALPWGGPLGQCAAPRTCRCGVARHGTRTAPRARPPCIYHRAPPRPAHAQRSMYRFVYRRWGSTWSGGTTCRSTWTSRSRRCRARVGGGAHPWRGRARRGTVCAPRRGHCVRAQAVPCAGGWGRALGVGARARGGRPHAQGLGGVRGGRYLVGSLCVLVMCVCGWVGREDIEGEVAGACLARHCARPGGCARSGHALVGATSSLCTHPGVTKGRAVLEEVEGLEGSRLGGPEAGCARGSCPPFSPSPRQLPKGWDAVRMG
jgi:hypothetical protein